MSGLPETRFYLDCEFDGHNGRLLSMALVRDAGRSLYVTVMATAADPWVRANVVPLLDGQLPEYAGATLAHVHPDSVGEELRAFIGDDPAPTIIADSPVDIGRFCAALSTGQDGGWASTEYPLMRFEVHNVDCYPTDLPGAVQHNAWWDAMALRHLLTERAKGGDA